MATDLDQIMTRLASIAQWVRVDAPEHAPLSDEEQGLLRSSAADMLARGYSVEDIISVLRNTEEVNPTVAEHVALDRMRKIHAKYPA